MVCAPRYAKARAPLEALRKDAAARPHASSELSEFSGDETASTRSGEDSPPRSPPTSAACGASSDSEAGGYAHVEQCALDVLLVYPVALLLRLRGSARRASNALGYWAQPIPSRTSSTPSVSSTKAPADGTASTGRLVQAGEEGDEAIIRKARSILNKLTVEKFEGLYEQLATSGLRTAAHIGRLMQEIFEKATVQHHFIPMYADLCMRLESDSRTVPEGEQGRGGSFRSLLLDRCQTAFEELLDRRGGVRGGEDDEEARLVRKQRALGNVKLVGQLVVRGMLSSRLLVQCAEDLLQARGACAEALESLAAFLEVAAPTFDVQSWVHWPQLNAIFGRVLELSKDRAVTARERFLLQDVLELRATSWPGRSKAARPSAPMRLEEVRTKAAEETCQATVPARSRGAGSPLAGLQGIVNGESKQPSKDAISCGSAFGSIEPRGRCRLEEELEAPTRPRAAPGAQRRRGKFLQEPVQASAPWAPAERQQRLPQPGACAVEAGRPAVAAASAKPASTAAAATVPVVSTGAAAPPEQAPEEKPAAAGPGKAEPFCPVTFRRALAGIMKELSLGQSVPAAVRAIRAQRVPAVRQAAEFADILTRAAEECRGPARRSAFAFAAGLAAADETSAFARTACLQGTGIFFREVYEDLREEVPRLAIIVKAEMLPTLRSVLPESGLRALAPPELWVP